MGVESEKTEARENDNGGHWVVRLKISSIVTIFFLGFVAISLAYIAGVMSGRHSSGEGSVTAAGQVEAAAPIEESPAHKEILTAEELEFARVLRGQKPHEKAPAQDQSPAPAVDQTSAEKKEDAQPDASQTAPVAPASAQAAPASPDKLEPGTAIYDYVYQAGAFKDERSADNLRQKLEEYGVRTRLERSGKLFIVLIMLRGNEARAAEILQIANSLKLGAPLLRSRKPVGN